MKFRTYLFAGSLLCFLVSLTFFTGCAGTVTTKETELTPGGNVTYQANKTNAQLDNELRRVFANTVLEAQGSFENSNESLARKGAVDIAVTELAGRVQTLVRSESTIYNRTDIRDVIETQIKAIVNNYSIDFGGYDPGTKLYRVRISIKGEQLVREIETRIKS